MLGSRSRLGGFESNDLDRGGAKSSVEETDGRLLSGCCLEFIVDDDLLLNRLKVSCRLQDFFRRSGKLTSEEELEFRKFEFFLDDEVPGGAALL